MKPISLLFLSGLFLLLSCKKKEPCNKPDEHYKIDSTEDKKVPYSGMDTLRFYYHDSLGSDTITYIGQGRQYQELRHDKFGSAEQDCVWWGWAEQYTILYKADMPGMDLEFKVIAQGGGNTFQI